MGHSGQEEESLLILSKAVQWTWITNSGIGLLTMYGGLVSVSEIDNFLYPDSNFIIQLNTQSISLIEKSICALDIQPVFCKAFIQISTSGPPAPNTGSHSGIGTAAAAAAFSLVSSGPALVLL